MGTVVGAIHHDGVIGDTQLVEQVEHFTNALVVIDHHVVILRLPATAAAHILGTRIGAEVHVGGVKPDEEGLARGNCIANKTLCLSDEFVIGRLHPLTG